MTAMFATTTFVVQLAGGGSQLVIEGGLRDSLHPVVVAYPALFSASPAVAGKGHVDGKLAQYLAAYPTGP